jgi:hypothetical protein
MNRWYILDENNNPVPTDTLVAARWFEDNANNPKRVAEVEPGVSLSTVFLALDHSFTPGKVLLYESLWFGGTLDGNMRRYSTREEALVGHEEMLAEYGNEEMADAMAEAAKDIVERNL